MIHWYRRVSWVVLIVTATAALAFLTPTQTGYFTLRAEEQVEDTSSQEKEYLQTTASAIDTAIETLNCGTEVNLKTKHTKKYQLLPYDSESDKVRYLRTIEYLELDRDTGVLTLNPTEEYFGFHTAIIVLEDSEGKFRSCVIKVKVS